MVLLRTKSAAHVYIVAKTGNRNFESGAGHFKGIVVEAFFAKAKSNPLMLTKGRPADKTGLSVPILYIELWSLLNRVMPGVTQIISECNALQDNL